MSFWRNAVRTIFKIMLFLCIGATVVVSFAFRNLLSLIILLGGTAAILILFSAWGMYIEMCDNIAYIKANTSNPSAQQPINTNFTNSAVQPNAVCSNTHKPTNVNYSYSAVPVQPNTVNTNVTWICRHCGTQGSTAEIFCKNCGNKREQ